MTPRPKFERCWLGPNQYDGPITDYCLAKIKMLKTIRATAKVNPEPRAYASGFGALPLQRVRNIHPPAYAQGLLWYGVKGTD